MTEIIEPNPLLIEYLEIAYNISSNLNSNLQDFSDAGEWHYVQADLGDYIFFFKRLEEVGILPNEINACDCGIGIGTILFDLYLQSKEYTDRKFTFTGIEKYNRYIDFVNKNLIKYWDGQLNLIHDDIMNQNYSKYNFIYFFSLLKYQIKLWNFIQK